ncbi:ABC transporter ATP-binding protein [Candidatus Woesebacteria bacterium]|nr:ABC transporter ATP-binding protein [Candidatus Woesebacteria bacterium]MCB9802190.1 ABC transporter ATP-binding protein [Pseudomonadales bacterium]
MNKLASAITIQNVSKLYYKQHQRTLKEFIPALLGRNKTHETFWAVKNIDLEVKKGESIGIIGPNGSGKSTLLKLIAGVTQPTSGSISVTGRIAPLIELGAGFHPELTGRENVFLNGVILGMTRAEIEKKFKTIVDFAELWEFIDQPIKHYSSGMYLRLAFAVAIHTDPEILLIDEILAVGDHEFQRKCVTRIEEMKKNKVTIVVVSHSPDLIREHTEHALWLEGGEVKDSGGAKKVVAKYFG